MGQLLGAQSQRLGLGHIGQADPKLREPHPLGIVADAHTRGERLIIVGADSASYRNRSRTDAAQRVIQATSPGRLRVRRHVNLR